MEVLNDADYHGAEPLQWFEERLGSAPDAERDMLAEIEKHRKERAIVYSGNRQTRQRLKEKLSTQFNEEIDILPNFLHRKERFAEIDFSDDEIFNFASKYKLKNLHQVESKMGALLNNPKRRIFVVGEDFFESHIHIIAPFPLHSSPFRLTLYIVDVERSNARNLFDLVRSRPGGIDRVVSYSDIVLHGVETSMRELQWKKCTETIDSHSIGSYSICRGRREVARIIVTRPQFDRRGGWLSSHSLNESLKAKIRYHFSEMGKRERKTPRLMCITDGVYWNWFAIWDDPSLAFPGTRDMPDIEALDRMLNVTESYIPSSRPRFNGSIASKRIADRQVVEQASMLVKEFITEEGKARTLLIGTGSRENKREIIKYILADSRKRKARVLHITISHHKFTRGVVWTGTLEQLNLIWQDANKKNLQTKIKTVDIVLIDIDFTMFWSRILERYITPSSYTMEILARLNTSVKLVGVVDYFADWDAVKPYEKAAMYAESGETLQRRAVAQFTDYLANHLNSARGGITEETLQKYIAKSAPATNYDMSRFMKSLAKECGSKGCDFNSNGTNTYSIPPEQEDKIRRILLGKSRNTIIGEWRAILAEWYKVKNTRTAEEILPESRWNRIKAMTYLLRREFKQDLSSRNAAFKLQWLGLRNAGTIRQYLYQARHPNPDSRIPYLHRTIRTTGKKLGIQKEAVAEMLRMVPEISKKIPLDENRVGRRRRINQKIAAYIIHTYMDQHKIELRERVKKFLKENGRLIRQVRNWLGEDKSASPQKVFPQTPPPGTAATTYALPTQEEGESVDSGATPPESLGNQEKTILVEEHNDPKSRARG